MAASLPTSGGLIELFEGGESWREEEDDNVCLRRKLKSISKNTPGP